MIQDITIICTTNNNNWTSVVQMFEKFLLIWNFSFQVVLCIEVNVI